MRSAEASVVDALRVDGNKNHIPLSDTFPDLQDTLENQDRPALVWEERQAAAAFSLLTESVTGKKTDTVAVCQNKVLKVSVCLSATGLVT